jgi:ABC-type spermidine/putrescine transport system permease subunit I
MIFRYACVAEVRMLFFSLAHLILFLLIAAFWSFLLYMVLRSYQALQGIEKSIADIAQTLRTKN